MANAKCLTLNTAGLHNVIKRCHIANYLRAEKIDVFLQEMHFLTWRGTFVLRAVPR